MNTMKSILISAALLSVSVSAFSATDTLTASGIGLNGAIKSLEAKAEKQNLEIVKITSAGGENFTRVSAKVKSK